MKSLEILPLRQAQGQNDKVIDHSFFVWDDFGMPFEVEILKEWIGPLQKILAVLIIVVGTGITARIAVRLVKKYTRKEHGLLPSISIFTNLTRVIVFTIGLLVLLQTFGISITPILTALGVGGLAVALALQDTLSNLFSGLHILVSRQVKLWDYVKLESGEEGYVTDVTWRNTTIRSLANNMVIIPNAKLASAIITNYYQPEPEMSVSVPVGVSYESDLKKVEAVTIEVAKEVLKEVEGGIPHYEPFIRYHTFGDFSIQFSVILRVKEFVHQYLIKHEFIKRLSARYQKEHIYIPFPVQTVHLKQIS